MASIRLNTQRLDYLTGRLSDQSLIDQTLLTHTGMSTARWKDYQAGKIALGVDTQKALRNLYERTVYAQARETGMSTVLARATRTLSEETRTRRVDRMEQIVQHLTDTKIPMKIVRNPSLADYYSSIEYRSILEESVRESLRKSKKTVATIEREGSP